MRRLSRKVALAIIAATALGSSFFNAKESFAQSFTGELNGANYDFSIVGPGSFESLQSNLEATPWWGDATLAESAANLVGDSLGLIDFEAGPNFAYEVVDGEYPSVNSYAYDPWEESAILVSPSTEINHTQFATATATPVAVPEINGSALALIVFILGVLSLHISNRRGTIIQGTTFA